MSTTYWPNKKKKSEGSLNDSTKIGTWITWYENGNVCDSGSYVPLVLNNLNVYIDEYYMAQYKIDTISIKSVNLKQNKETKTGKWASYNSAGKISEAGEYLPIAYIQIDFIKDSDNNDMYVYTEPNSMKIGNWKYYEDGLILAEQVYVYGKPSGYGNRIEYYTNGIKKSEGFYDEFHFQRTGWVKEWDVTGKLIKESNYDAAGSLIEEKKY